MKRFAGTGEIAEPRGVPLSRAATRPSGILTGAARHRFAYGVIHRCSCVTLACPAFTPRCPGAESKNFPMSGSITRLFARHRSRHVPMASSAPRPRRQPQESSWKIDSARGSSALAATVSATRPPTVGTPRILVPPGALGISTARTGGGKYVPGDLRFQILYK